MLKESDLYPTVKQFMKKKDNCIDVFVEAGKQRIGSVDVYGVYYTNIEKTEIETIGVEVKIDKIPISANFGQAKGYTIFCDRIFFASLDQVNGKDRKFDADDLEIAQYLGIGLIQIENTPSGFTCYEVLEAPKNQPIKKHSDYALKCKKILACNSCKIIQQFENNYTQIPCKLSEVPTYSNATYIKNQIKFGKCVLGKAEFYCNKCAREKLKIN